MRVQGYSMPFTRSTMNAIRRLPTGTAAGRVSAGVCAVRVNGEPVLACMEEARDGATIEPLDLPVIKDLAVDLLPYIEALPINLHRKRLQPQKCPGKTWSRP